MKKKAEKFTELKNNLKWKETRRTRMKYKRKNKMQNWHN